MGDRVGQERLHSDSLAEAALVHHCALGSQYVRRRPHRPPRPTCSPRPAKCVLSVCISFDVRIVQRKHLAWLADRDRSEFQLHGYGLFQ